MRDQHEREQVSHELKRVVGLIVSGVSKFTLPTPDPIDGRHLCLGAARQLENLAKDLLNEEKKCK